MQNFLTEGNTCTTDINNDLGLRRYHSAEYQHYNLSYTIDREPQSGIGRLCSFIIQKAEHMITKSFDYKTISHHLEMKCLDSSCNPDESNKIAHSPG